MKKRTISLILVGILLLLSLLCMSCGNRQLVDTVWTFEEAYIQLPGDKTIHGKIESWKDFDNSDMIQVTINGKTYLTHSCNVVLMSTD